MSYFVDPCCRAGELEAVGISLLSLGLAGGLRSNLQSKFGDNNTALMIGLYVDPRGDGLFLYVSFRGGASAALGIWGFPRTDHVGKRVFHHMRPADRGGRTSRRGGCRMRIRQDDKQRQRIINYLTLAVIF